ncbi:hypothetical protein [Phocaeicola sp.]|uniref:hypothetical protein n=1 Tax=Phocaeicola sp. TaxID=2773926 RepID=UPI003AB5B81C
MGCVDLKIPGKQGFMALSRRLLNTMFDEMYGRMHTDAEAYVYLLMKACFSDQGEGPGKLKRGEMVYSSRELSMRFGWSRGRMRRFLARLELEGVVSTAHTAHGSKLKLLYYEELCHLKVSRKSGERPKNLTDESFDVFWEQYHALTQQPAVDIEATRKAWGKLTLSEREEAIGNMEMYLCLLPSIDRARSALNYLLMKSFVIN